MTPHDRIGVISNPRSHANRRGTASQPAAPAGVLVTHPASLPDLQAALHDYAASGVDLLVISGGDGTVREVLTALPLAYGEALPDIALIHAGNTNLAARALGGIGAGDRALRRLIAADRAGRLRPRQCPVLQVDWLEQPLRPPVRGFLFGAAAYATAKRDADAHVHRRGVHEALAVAMATSLATLRVLFGGAAHLGAPISLTLDAAPACERRRFLVMATTLDRLMLGLFPFWGTGSGGLRWLDVDAPPRRLALALPSIWLGRGAAWLARAGYRSGRAHRLALRLEEHFVLDGEFFDPGPAGVLLSSPWSVRVVTP